MTCLEITEADGIATVTLNRPDKKNAMSLEMFDALSAAGRDLDRPDIRAVILTGAGDAFCAGIDLSAMQSFLPRIDQVRTDLQTFDDSGANWFQRPTRVWQQLPVPVIAAIDGVCLGAGLQLALAADFRIAAPSSRLSIMEAKWGLIPDMGITTTLPALLRADLAKELMMSARILDAPEALSLGLLTRLSDAPLEDALTLARNLAGKSPDALSGIKTLVDEGWNGPSSRTLALEARLQADIIGGVNQIEAVMSAMQKRPPKFKPRGN